MAKKKNDNNISDLVEDYLASCWANGVKRKTVDNTYGHSLRKVFLPYCKNEGFVASFRSTLGSWIVSRMT